MRRFTLIVRGFAGATLLGMLLATMSTSCAQDEILNACECSYNGCIDPMGVPAPQSRCDLASGPYTYEECGIFCDEEMPKRLKAEGFTMCGKATTTYAKNSCSPGSPVGE